MTESAAPVRVALVNDYEIIVAGLAELLTPHTDRVVVVDLAADALPDRPADVALFDTYGHRGPGFELIGELAADGRFERVAVFSAMVAPHLVDRALAAGAVGYLPKSLTGAELADALVRIAAGEQVVLGDGARRPSKAAVASWPGVAAGLTERESELLVLVARGLRNDEIAEAMYVSLNTVKSHLKSAFRKLGARNRAEAAAAITIDGSFNRRSGSVAAG